MTIEGEKDNITGRGQTVGRGLGPIGNSTLIARGATPRISIGSISLAEFLVTAAISATFVMMLDLATYG